MTPNSSSASYLTSSDFLLRKDVFTAGDLVRDDGSQATSAELATDLTLGALLKQASGMVEAACVAGNRYLPTDLQALVSAGGNGAEYLKGIIADIAAHLLTARRWRFSGDTLKPYEQALEILKALRNGDSVFPFVEAEAAGVADSQFYTQADIDRLNLISRDTRVFGIRNSYKCF
jgi:hypothetical protein